MYSSTSPRGHESCIDYSCDGEILCDIYGYLACCFSTAGDHDIYICTPGGCITQTVTVVGVDSVTADKTACCENDPIGIAFTANANPSGQQMRCIRWQFRYSSDDPNLDSQEWSETFGGDTTITLIPNAWTGAGYYQFRALNGDPDYDDAWAASPVVKVIPLVSRIEIEYQYNNWAEVTEQSITLLKGTKYWFRAVSSSGQWIENLPTWTGVGSGSGETIEITFADVGDFTLTATAADCGEKTVYIEVVEPKVYQISFEGDNALYWGPAAPNNPSEPNLVWCDGIEAISDPVYDAEQSINDPFCVTKYSSGITAGVVLKVPQAMTFTTEIEIAALGTQNWQQASASFSGMIAGADLQMVGNVVNTVKAYMGDFNIEWKYGVPYGTNAWYDIETTKHTAYVTWGTPAPAGTNVTVKRIEFVCTAADGASTVETVADGIHSNLTGLPFGSDPIQSDDWYLKQGSSYRGECDEHARFMIRALELIGIQGAVPSFIYASSDSNCLSLEGRPYNGRTKWLVMDFDSSSGYGWNAFEGVCFFWAYYAVTPNVKASSSVEMLRTLSPQQYWVLTVNNIPPGEGGWIVETVLGLEPLP
jgi:hypothetical protein